MRSILGLNHPPFKFHGNPLRSFCVVLFTNQPTNQQTDRQGQKHNPLGGGTYNAVKKKTLQCLPLEMSWSGNVKQKKREKPCGVSDQ